jgi:ribosomal protein S18 acetylase RimI-like enzyme
MNEGYQVAYVEKPEESAWGIIGNGLNDFNQQQAGNDTFQRICFALYAPDRQVVGGVVGMVYWDWFYIDMLWIKAEFRGLGYGHRLLSQAEDEARKRGARHAHLDTFSFQAPDFYKQHGYRVFGELQDFPHGHQRYYLTKEL